MIGYPFSGKTTFAEHFARRTNMTTIISGRSFINGFTPLAAGKLASEMAHTPGVSGITIILDYDYMGSITREAVLSAVDMKHIDIEYWFFKTNLERCIERFTFSDHYKNIRDVGIYPDWYSYGLSEKEIELQVRQEVRVYDITDSDGNVPYYIRAIDYDRTLCSGGYPELGTLVDGAVKQLRTWWNEDPFNLNIIWTCRTGKALQDVFLHLMKNKVAFDYLNFSPIMFTGGYGPKIYADEYIDDKNKAIPWKVE